MTFNPVGQQYKPDALASGGATERPLGAMGGAPKGNPAITTTLLKLALRRLPAHGFAATKQTTAIHPPKNAFTMGAHGKLS